MSKSNFKQGDKLGIWTVDQLIGEGECGRVYRGKLFGST